MHTVGTLERFTFHVKVIKVIIIYIICKAFANRSHRSIWKNKMQMLAEETPRVIQQAILAGRSMTGGHRHHHRHLWLVQQGRLSVAVQLQNVMCGAVCVHMCTYYMCVWLFVYTCAHMCVWLFVYTCAHIICVCVLKQMWLLVVH